MRLEHLLIRGLALDRLGNSIQEFRNVPSGFRRNDREKVRRTSLGVLNAFTNSTLRMGGLVWVAREALLRGIEIFIP